MVSSETMTVILYFGVPIISLLLIFFANRKYILFSAFLTAIIDVFVWKDVFMHNHGELRGVLMLFLVPQIIAVFIISLLIFKFCRNK